MPLIVDRRKRDASIFLGDDPFFDQHLLPKRIRLSEAASFRLSPPPPSAAAVGHCGATSPLDLLKAGFPHMDDKLVEKVLEASGNNLDFAIESLNKLPSGSQWRDLDSAASNSSVPVTPNVSLLSEGCVVGSSGGPTRTSDLPADGSGWVELLLRELATVSNINDLKVCASRVLELFQNCILARASAEAAESLGKENKMLKDQLEAVLHDSSILKRAVAIQHERQKAYDAQNEELQHLQQMLAQCKEHVKTLELKNYALAMHLREADQRNSLIPGHFHPDVF